VPLESFAPAPHLLPGKIFKAAHPMLQKPFSTHCLNQCGSSIRLLSIQLVTLSSIRARGTGLTYKSFSMESLNAAHLRQPACRKQGQKVKKESHACSIST
jgi:hypothetical protein